MPPPTTAPPTAASTALSSDRYSFADTPVGSPRMSPMPNAPFSSAQAAPGPAAHATAATAAGSAHRFMVGRFSTARRSHHGTAQPDAPRETPLAGVGRHESGG